MRPSEPSLVQLWLSGGLDLSEQLQKEAPQRPAEDDDRRPAEERDTRRDAEPVSTEEQGAAHVPAVRERTKLGEPIYEGELVDHDPAAEFGGHDPDDDLVAGYADGGFDGDGDGFGDGAGAGVPDEEPIEVPEGRLTVRDIMLRLEWEKREALGPGTGDTR